MEKRTNQQNRALHLFFTHLAKELNEAGLDMRRTLKEEVAIPWNADTVKDFLWRPIQLAQVQKESTTELSTKDIDAIYDTLTRYLGEKHGVFTEFPSINGLLLKDK